MAIPVKCLSIRLKFHKSISVGVPDGSDNVEVSEEDALLPVSGATDLRHQLDVVHLQVVLPGKFLKLDLNYQGSKVIRQWPINRGTSPMMIQNIIPSVDYN